ncbi:MAG: hypothetical protein KatS3mg054_0782 [Chloroflexus sp.]|jgi:hypothetical protein|nr:MAG: hypothetical protein KatS3mg054_0782 [Chloroflexus sp.]
MNILGWKKGDGATRPDSDLWGRESGKAGLLTRAFSRQRSASLHSLRAAADAPIVSPLNSSAEVHAKVQNEREEHREEVLPCDAQPHWGKFCCSSCWPS